MSRTTLFGWIAILTGWGGLAPVEAHPHDSTHEQSLTCPQALEGFPIDERWPAELDRTVFEQIKVRAAEEQSTSLILIHDGKLIHRSNPSGKGDWNDRTPMMSVSKSVVALHFGMLVDKGTLTLDEPLSTRLIPEWKGDQRKEITLRHLLNHSSGLDGKRYHQTTPQGDSRTQPTGIEKHGLAASLVSPVGSKFAYNNQATSFLSVVSRRASQGASMDDYLQLTLFYKLGVVGALWETDPLGTPMAEGGLYLRPIDLAKIGQLVLDGGMWQGERLLSETWMKQMLSPGSSLSNKCGLLWWLRRPKTKEPGQKSVWAFAADGYLGQQLIIVPSKRLIAVRTRDPRKVGFDEKRYNYHAFLDEIYELAKMK